MAERRMFSKTIIDSDAFLDMPQSSQLLYFHLAMRADDDGFINNPKSIMRNVKCNEDDLKLLIVKKFLIPFESGVVVIKHWRIHNYIRNDRYKETKYKEEKASLGFDENNAYTQSKNCLVDQMDTNGIPVVYQMDTQYGETQVRLGKDRLEIELGEDRLELGKDNTPPLSPSQVEAKTNEKQKNKSKSEKHQYGEYRNVLLTDEEINRLFKKYGEDKTIEAIKYLDESIEMYGYKYKSHNLALQRWVFDAVERDKKKQNKNTPKENINASRQSQLDYLLNSIKEAEKNE